MTFSIRSFDTDSLSRGKCELIIDDHKELFPLVTTLWARKAYELQWKEALLALLAGHVDSCVLITDIQPPQDSSGITYWAMYKEGQNVYLQEHISRDRTAFFIGSASAVAPHIPSRIQGTSEEQSQVSEWSISIEAVRQFVRYLGIEISSDGK